MKPFYVLLAIVSLISTSCYHIYYSPNTPNTPLLSQKGEGRINGMIGSGANSDYTSGELQLAYALTNHVGLMVNGFTASNEEQAYEANYYEKGKGSYAEIAPGFFTAIGRNAKWRAEVYGGIGTGTVTNDYGWSELSKVGSTKLLLQPAIGYKSKNFEIAFTPKWSFVNWKVKTEHVNETQNPEDKYDISYIKNNPHFTAFEPALIIRGGSRNVKAQLGIALSRTSHANFEAVENGLVSLGISIGFNNTKIAGR